MDKIMTILKIQFQDNLRHSYPNHILKFLIDFYHLAENTEFIAIHDSFIKL